MAEAKTGLRLRRVWAEQRWSPDLGQPVGL